MFSLEEIAFMKSLGINANFDNLSDDDYYDIEMIVGDELMISGFDINYDITPIGIMCEQIIDKLPK